MQFISPDKQICWPGQVVKGSYGTECLSEGECGQGLTCEGKKESYCFRGLCTQGKAGVCREKSQKCTAEGDACLTDASCCKDLTCKTSEILFIWTCQRRLLLKLEMNCMSRDDPYTSARASAY